ncbi:MAG: hypothetical protein ABWY49_08830, partial [Rhizobium sp.]
MEQRAQSLRKSRYWGEAGPAISTWLVLAAATFSLSVLFGSPTSSAGLYLVYQALFVALPGLVVL